MLGGACGSQAQGVVNLLLASEMVYDGSEALAVGSRDQCSDNACGLIRTGAAFILPIVWVKCFR